MAFPLLGLGGAARATMPLWRLLGRGRFNPFRAEIPRVPGGLAGQRAGSPRVPTGVGGRTRFPDPIPGRTPGFLNPAAHKGRFIGATAGVGAGIPWMMRGEEEAPMPMAIPGQVGGAGPGSFLPSAVERSRASRQRWMENLKTMTTYGGILGAIDPDKKESFNKDVSEAMKQMSGYTQDIELSKITDAALKAGQTPRERYMAMIREGATPEEAALVSGHQVELIQAEQTSMGAKAQVWDNIMQTLMAGNVEAAALMLVQAWGTGQLGGAPITENFEQRIETARLYLTGIMEGETAATAPGAGSGITDISLS